MKTLILAVFSIYFVYIQALEYGQPRIVGGYDADISEAPYLVSLQLGSHICGASILSSRVLLTAAHCVYDTSAEDLWIRAGSINIYEGGVKLKVKDYLMHPNYVKITYDTDVALLFLEDDIFDACPTCEAVKLGSYEPQADENLTIRGWGKLSEEGSSPDTLKGVTIQIMEKSKCQEMMYIVNITENMFCARRPGHGTCEGDSGSPAMDDNGLQVGIVSFGVCPGDHEYPVVYTTVNQFLNWIESEKQKHEALYKHPQQRIVNGEDADISEAPYLVSFQLNSAICGASIISNRVILTAAHCVYGESASRMWIRAGSTNKYKGGVKLKVRDYIMHPNYVKFTKDSDIALVFLEDDIFQACPTCEAVKLGTAEPQPGENLTIRGWGRLAEGASSSDTLKKITIQIMEKKKCQEILYIYNITENMFCAQKHNQGVCDGDSGSPNMNDNGEQVGIVSFGPCGGDHDYPAVYVTVSQFLDWIEYYKQMYETLYKHPQQRIVNGEDADISEAPYLVSFQLNSAICGASIISNRVILTAAHCVYGESASRMWIRAGSTNKYKGGVKLKVRDYIMHPNYIKFTKDSDIALVFLEDDIFQACPTCKAVKLGTAEPQPGENLTIRGWGRLAEGASSSDTLKKITIQIMEKKKCQEMLYIYNITENMFCAQKHNQGVCDGDSGSPNMNDNGEQVGIVSFGPCGGDHDYPAVYVTVSQFLDWIEYYKQMYETLYKHPQQRIVNGEDADISEAPYLVSFQLNSAICGASIISNRVILTAAHCVYGESASRMWIRAGSTNKYKGGVKLKVRDYIMHPNYVKFTKDSDIALVFLEDDIFQACPTCEAVKLGTAEPQPGENLTIRGWGRLAEGASSSDTLKKITIQIMEKKKCQEMLYIYNITENMFCAQKRDQGICSGDSGSPNMNDNGEQVGIVSFGPCGGDHDYPAVYVTVSQFLNWIEYYKQMYEALYKYPQQRIVNGEDADISEAPYLVSFQLNSHICGASILSNRVLLTAAHCVNDKSASEMWIRAGSTNKYEGGVKFKVRDYIMHPNYVKLTHDSDIALVFLEDDIFQACPTCEAVKLGTAEPQSGENLTIRGWGLLVEGGSSPDTLKKVTIQIMEKKKCQEMLYIFNITENMFCAQKHGQGICSGDSGSPNMNDNGEQVGIVSFGPCGGDHDYPAVYVTVSQFLDWIEYYKQMYDALYKQPQSRIINGEDSDISEAPYLVSLQLDSHICGASIISNKVLLTAAHCVFGKSADDLWIRAGSTNKKEGGVKINVHGYLIHPDYNKISHDSDIALLFIEDDILEACSACSLVELGTEKPQTDENLTIRGWGKLSQSSIGRYPDNVRKVTVKIMEKKYCQEMMYFYNITNNMFCGQRDNHDVCTGDFGSPAMDDNGRQIGIASFAGCAFFKYPAIYVDVSKFLNWIEYNKQRYETLYKHPGQRIVNGEDADISEAPYLVSLQLNSHICGASIISNKILLTAAHCVYGESVDRMWVRAGSTNCYEGGVKLKVKDYIMHPNYVKETKDSDIALLFLEDDILEACPTCNIAKFGTAEPKTGENLTIRGWGRLSQDGSYPDNLRRVTVQIMQKKRCQEMMYIFNITDNMFCGQRDNHGVCNGDSGSPAMDDNGLQVGVASFGACAQHGYPTVYVVVSQFIEWIDFYRQNYFEQ